jgi:hypothetical protein
MGWHSFLSPWRKVSMKEKQFKPASENSTAPEKGMASVQTSNSEEKSNPEQMIGKDKTETTNKGQHTRPAADKERS